MLYDSGSGGGSVVDVPSRAPYAEWPRILPSLAVPAGEGLLVGGETAPALGVVDGPDALP